MLNNEKNYTWDEVKSEFNYTLERFNLKYSDFTDIKELKVNGYTGDGYFYGLDWIYKDNYENRINWVCNKTDHFMYFGQAANKGTLYTAELIDENKDNNDLIAAILICAFYEAVTGRDGYSIGRAERHELEKISYPARKLMLANSLYYWHNQCTRHLPEIYASDLLEEIKDVSLENMMILIVLNLKLNFTDYKIVKYDSRTEEEKKSCVLI